MKGNYYKYTNSNGKKYRLCRSQIIVRGGKSVNVYYFISDGAKLKKSVYFADELPDGYEIIEDIKSKKPLVRKVRK